MCLDISFDFQRVSVVTVSRNVTGQTESPSLTPVEFAQGVDMGFAPAPALPLGACDLPRDHVLFNSHLSPPNKVCSSLPSLVIQ
jgi:hypothetical protein